MGQGKFSAPAIPPDTLDGIYRRLAELRTAAGLSKNALSLRAGLSPAAVHQIESRRCAPALGTLIALAAALGVPVGAILGEKKVAKIRRPAIADGM